MADLDISCRTCHERVATVRGCCLVCYGSWLKKVRAGKATWAELEHEGKAGPPRSDERKDAWGSGRLSPEEPFR